MAPASITDSAPTDAVGATCAEGSTTALACTPAAGTLLPVLGDTSRPLADARDDFVRRYVLAVLERCGGNREAAARELGIGVRTLYRYLE